MPARRITQSPWCRCARKRPASKSKTRPGSQAKTTWPILTTAFRRDQRTVGIHAHPAKAVDSAANHGLHHGRAPSKVRLWVRAALALVQPDRRDPDGVQSRPDKLVGGVPRGNTLMFMRSIQDRGRGKKLFDFISYVRDSGLQVRILPPTAGVLISLEVRDSATGYYEYQAITDRTRRTAATSTVYRSGPRQHGRTYRETQGTAVR